MALRALRRFARSLFEIRGGQSFLRLGWIARPEPATSRNSLGLNASSSPSREWRSLQKLAAPRIAAIIAPSHRYDVTMP